MKQPCLQCDVTPLDSRDRDLQRGDHGITGWRITSPPKHGGGCGAEWKGIGKTEPPSASEILLTVAEQLRDCAPQQNADTMADRAGEVSAFRFGTCDCGCGQTFDRCKTRTPEDAWKAAKAQYAAKRNGKPVVQRKAAPGTSGGVKPPKRGKGRNAR